MIYIQEDSFVDCYMNAIDALYNRPQFKSSPRGQSIHEILNAVLVVNKPEKNQILISDARRTSKKYLAAELLWYFSGRRDLEYISKYSKFWNNISDDGVFCNSAYGNLIFSRKMGDGQYNQWQWVLKCLKSDVDSRQAVMFVSRPIFQYDNIKDFICTLNYIFTIRDDVLYMTVNRRSQDIWFGLTYDFVWEYVLQQHVLLYLKEVYPNLELGPIIINCNSLHLYERNFETTKCLLEGEYGADTIPNVEKPLIDIHGHPIPLIGDIMDGNPNNFIVDSLLDWLIANSEK